MIYGKILRQSIFMANIKKSSTKFQYFPLILFEIQVENAPLPNSEQPSGPNGHRQSNTEPRKPPLPITSPKKPISQAEFQALLDAGYKVSNPTSHKPILLASDEPRIVPLPTSLFAPVHFRYRRFQYPFLCQFPFTLRHISHAAVNFNANLTSPSSTHNSANRISQSNIHNSANNKHQLSHRPMDTLM